MSLPSYASTSGWATLSTKVNETGGRSRGGEAAKLLWHPLWGERVSLKAKTLSWTTADYLVWHIKGNSFRRQFKKCRRVRTESPDGVFFSVCLIHWILYFFFCCFCSEFLFCTDVGAGQNAEEALQFLNKLLSAQQFLQVSTSCHVFIASRC